jgi:putative ABC transport system permease protein
MVLFHIQSDMWGDNRIVTVKYANHELKAILREVEERWNRRVNHTPLEYTFYDEVINAQYRREEQAGTLFSIFTILSITIAIIGLVGLVAYAAEQRKKEIGIRKVFGASLTGIYVMINVQYVRLLSLALLIATPITWWLMEQWLTVYPYRVDINPMIFVASGVVELVLALLCVGYLALRAASLNPVAVLKDE